MIGILFECFITLLTASWVTRNMACSIAGENLSSSPTLCRKRRVEIADRLARIHRRTPMDGVRKAEGGVRELQGK